MITLLRFIVLWLGFRNGNDHQYLFWSGFFADLTIFTAAGIWFRHHNCHSTWCLFPGHAVEGTPYLACHRHHPARQEHHRGRRSVALHVIHEHHEQAA